jgi:hypothetical protein
MPIILAIQEVRSGGSEFESIPEKKVYDIQYQPIKLGVVVYTYPPSYAEGRNSKIMVQSSLGIK